MASNSQNSIATDSASELNQVIGADATATFEADPKFIDSMPTANGSSENLAAAEPDVDETDEDDDIADEDDEDLEDEDDDAIEDEEDDEDEDDEDEDDDDDDDEDEVEDGDLDDDASEAVASPSAS